MSANKLKHIVFWKLKEHADGADRATNALKLKALLDGCADIVPGILHFEVAVAQPDQDATCDIVLYAEFSGRDALEAYQTHPQHEALKPFVALVKEERHCMDYVI
jgi:hypothetical protein